MNSQAEKGARFARSHLEPGIVVLANARDIASAIMMAEAGFSAIATTSAGIAFAMGLAGRTTHQPGSHARIRGPDRCGGAGGRDGGS